VIRRLLSQSWGILLLLAAWQVWVMASSYNSIIVVTPVSVIHDIAANPASYARPALWTLAFALLGLLGGMTAGLLLAILGWISQTFSGFVTPSALILSSTPVVCLIPLLARLFGYNSWTELVTIVIMTFFPSFVFAGAGLRRLPAMSDEVFAALNAGRVERLLLLALPAAVPNLAIALRIGAAYSILVAMISEFLMQTGGLGKLFAVTFQQFDMQRALGASLVATFLSLLLYAASGALETAVEARYR
jgi:ABC-type nitrate/sulfonate/bicarbonate transport system permease component